MQIMQEASRDKALNNVRQGLPESTTAGTNTGIGGTTISSHTTMQGVGGKQQIGSNARATNAQNSGQVGPPKLSRQQRSEDANTSNEMHQHDKSNKVAIKKNSSSQKSGQQVVCEIRGSESRGDASIDDSSPLMGPTKNSNKAKSHSENTTAGVRKIGIAGHQQKPNGNLPAFTLSNKDHLSVESSVDVFHHQISDDQGLNIQPYGGNETHHKSFGANQGVSVISDTEIRADAKTGQVTVTHGSSTTIRGPKNTNLTSQPVNDHIGSMSNKSDGMSGAGILSSATPNSNAHNLLQSAPHASRGRGSGSNQRMHGQTDGKKKRRSSDKHASGNKTYAKRIDVDGSGRSQSRGNGISNMQNNATGQGTIGNLPQNFYGPQFFDNATNQFNPFGQNFPFMAGSNQAPQVHFIAKKQQFIAQISPDQLMNGDKRPYTAQSLNNLSAGSKRAGAVYGGGTKSNIAAFSGSNHYGNSVNAKTHTGGFNFNNSIGKHTGGPHKYSHSHQGDDMIKPKVAGKDILQALSTSNGFQSGYHSDPYSSVIGSGGGLPTTITHSNRTGKSKNRMLAKEKEQLYDETIKMKIMNNQLRDDAVKLKTKIKILENELNRKEKTIEDLFAHNQLIQQSQLKGGSGAGGSSQNGGLVPLAQTAQKYQQETFLVMSLKKQIRELKYEVVRREEELEVLRKNIKNTKTKELEQEIAAYRDECMRMRSVIEDVLKEGASHPIHQQALNQRMQSYNAEMQQKNQVIANLTEQLQQVQVKLDSSIISSSQQNTQFSLNGYQNMHMNMDSSPQGPRDNLTNMTAGHLPSGSGNVTAGNISQMNATQNFIRSEKSAERVQKASSTSAGSAVQSQTAINQQSSAGTIDQKPAASKEVQRDLVRARKTLREKDKELMKLKSEVLQLKRQREEAGTKEREAVSGAEGLLKTMKEKLKQTTVEMKRRDERVNDMESKFRKLEDALKERDNALKSQEDTNKNLRDKLKAAKTDAAKKVKEVEDKKDDKKAVNDGKRRSSAESRTRAEATDDTPGLREESVSQKPAKAAPQVDKVVKAELRVMTLIGQREKLCRDDLTAMILSGEEALKMLIRKPSDQLVDFIRTNLDSEDAILLQIPRFDIPKADFETQVLREMRLVLRDNIDRITDFHEEELLQWDKFVPFYESLENFEYPHKDKLLDFVKYFFLDHIETADKLLLNYAAFKEHVTAKRGAATAERTRNESGLKSRRRSHESVGSAGGDSEAAVRRRILGLSDDVGTPGRSSAGAGEEERMLDVAEQCFMRIADMLHTKRETVKQAFGRFATPESFKDGSTLDLLGPRAFLAGVREVGFEDITELEATSLMKVLAKPELDGAVILNEFVLIMENFGIPAVTEEDEYENDYAGDTDDEKADQERDVPPVEEATSPKSDGAKKNMTLEQRFNKAYWQARKSKAKHPVLIRFTDLQEKALKVLKKLARFLLERYMHPREFFGPTIKKEIVGKKNSKVEVIKLHDFYLRLKLASIRKKLKEKPELNAFLAIDGDKVPGFVHVKRLIRALELIAEGEQEVLIKEQQEKERLAKEKFEQEQKERAENGLPPLKLDTEEDSKSDGGKDKKKAAGADSIIGKDNTTDKKGGLDDMLKLTAGARSSSPQGGKEAGAAANRFTSQLGPQGHLNTIEEDLHETQTSHYSQQVREGDGTDRDGASSRHQLSTSNHLRNSNALHELDDSARRSINNASLTLPNKASGGSGSSRKNNSSRAAPNASSSSAEQYSGGVKGSNTSPKRETHKVLLFGASSEKGHDISDFDVCIEQQPIRLPTHGITKEQIEENLKAEDEDEKEDLESEVDKKMAQVLEIDTQKTMEKYKEKEADSSASDGDEYYEDEREYDEMARGIGLALTDVQNGMQSKSNSHRDEMPGAQEPVSQRNGMSPDGVSQEFNSAHELTTDNRGEDTIKTDKIEAAVEEEMRARSKVVRIGGGLASSVDHSIAAASAPAGRGSSQVFDSAQHSAYGDSAGLAVNQGLQDMLLLEQSAEKRIIDDHQVQQQYKSNSVAFSGYDQSFPSNSGLTSKSVKNPAVDKEVMLVGGGQACETDEGTCEEAVKAPVECKDGSESDGGDYTFDDDELAVQLQDESNATAAAMAEKLRAEHGLVPAQAAEIDQEEDYEI